MVFGGENFGGEGGPVDWTPADEHIVEQINEKFTRHPSLDGNSIVVTSNKGLVRLRGRVRSAEAKTLAEEAAKTVSGVNSVESEIHVESGRVL